MWRIRSTPDNRNCIKWVDSSKSAFHEITGNVEIRRFILSYVTAIKPIFDDVKTIRYQGTV